MFAHCCKFLHCSSRTQHSTAVPSTTTTTPIDPDPQDIRCLTGPFFPELSHVMLAVKKVCACNVCKFIHYRSRMTMNSVVGPLCHRTADFHSAEGKVIHQLPICRQHGHMQHPALLRVQRTAAFQYSLQDKTSRHHVS